jgi:LacI family transcriptional regulator, galactose operon repressor
MATLADVARRAGVSQATASRIINGSPKLVTDELRTRVLRAVEELHYVPNAHAQMLARAQRTAVGVIAHDISDPYFAEITRGLQRVATEHGRLVIVCNSYRDPERELEYVELLRAHQVAAIVLAGSGYHNPAFTKALNVKLDAYTRTGGRVTVIGRHERNGDAVLPQNEVGGFLIGAELFALPPPTASPGCAAPPASTAARYRPSASSTPTSTATAARSPPASYSMPPPTSPRSSR